MAIGELESATMLPGCPRSRPSGTVVGGLIAVLVSVRAALVIGALGGVVAIVILWFSAIRRIHDLPGGVVAPRTAVMAGDDVPLSE